MVDIKVASQELIAGVKTAIEMEVGGHSIFIECTDEAGDIVQKDTTLTIIRDTSGPEIVNFGNLQATTNEEADCRYSQTSCSFDFNSGTSMQTGYTLTHSVSSSGTYYIKCKDDQGNTGVCTTINFP